MQKVLSFILAIAILSGCSTVADIAQLDESSSSPNAATEAALAKAFETQQSDLQIEGQGRVIKILPDDTKGSQHQRFIIELSSGQTVLIAHNIDLAPRIDSLNQGDLVQFYGEYEWNSKGGVIHWTHHDPAGRHVDGWLKHNGVTYQ